MDIAGVHFTTGNLMVYFNNGNGGFHAPVTYSSVAGDSSMDFGDVDNDGDTDIVVGDSGAAFSFFVIRCAEKHKSAATARAFDA